MHFVLICRDTPDSAAKRPATRPAHLAYWKPIDDAGRLLLAGPLTDRAGSIFIFEAGSREEVARFASQDPYFTEGVFEAFEIHPFRPVLPAARFGGS